MGDQQDSRQHRGPMTLAWTPDPWPPAPPGGLLRDSLGCDVPAQAPRTD
jgi:hypothetical protein